MHWKTLSSAAALGVFAAVASAADVTPEWVRRIPTGPSPYHGFPKIEVAAPGTTYLGGNTGSSNNTDVVTAAFDPAGNQVWTRTWDGAAAWHDQSRALVLGADGLVYVAGNTPGPGSYANVAVLGYEPATGTLVRTIQFSSGPQTSEYAASLAVDAAGRVFAAGGTVGDGSDALIVAFGPEGELLWRSTWDGAAWGPYSQDAAIEVLLDPAGNPVVLIHGVAASSHPDYVVVKYAAADGAVLWEASFGVTGEDSPTDMALDSQGDVYVTGTGIDFVNKYSTVRFRGSDGSLAWQAYDSAAARNTAAAIALDGQGGVYVTGTIDPDGNISNFNDDIYTVKRAAADGALAWTHRYGQPCVGCYDVAGDVAVDAAGHAFVAGSTSSPPYTSDAILLVLRAADGTESDRGIMASEAGTSASWQEVELDGSRNVLLGGTASNPSTGALELLVAKYAALSGGGEAPCRFGQRACLGR